MIRVCLVLKQTITLSCNTVALFAFLPAMDEKSSCCSKYFPPFGIDDFSLEHSNRYSVIFLWYAACLCVLINHLFLNLSVKDFRPHFSKVVSLLNLQVLFYILENSSLSSVSFSNIVSLSMAYFLIVMSTFFHRRFLIWLKLKFSPFMDYFAVVFEKSSPFPWSSIFAPTFYLQVL